jgi:formiminotetrahydrofolate cyclodeaminase
VEVPGHEPFADLTVREFVRRLATGDPVPGGGSAAAVAAALGASLVGMVAALSEGRAKYADHAALHGPVRERARELGQRLLALADEDSSAYAAFAAAQKLPRESDEEARARATAMHAAARRAAEVPLECLEACLGVVAAAESLAGRSNRNAASDLDVATLLAEAAAGGAGANVLVNLPSLDQADPFVGRAMTRVDELQREVQRLATLVHAVVLAGESRAPIEVASVGTGG